MATTEREISEGLPIDGTKFTRPQESKDREQSRFVAILGSFIVPETVFERPFTRGGGIEVTNPCLRYVKHFVRKGRITPVLHDRHEWCSQDYWERATGKDASYFPRPIPAGYQAPTNEMGYPSRIAAMMAKEAYPGDQMESIINGSANLFKRSRRGIVELKTLKGQPYNPQDLGNDVIADAEIWKIQKTIFPTYPFMPVLLEETEQLLQDARAHTYLRPIVDEMMLSLNQFRDHARSAVEHTHYTMRETPQKSEIGYIPQYTDLDFVLLEQLGMAREDINIRREGASRAPAVAGDPELREMFKAWMQASLEEKQMILADRAVVDRVPDAPEDEDPPVIVDSHTMAATSIEGFPGASGFSGFSGAIAADAIEHEVIYNSSPANAETIANALADSPEFVCVCGRAAGSLAGLKAHERHCEAVTKE